MFAKTPSDALASLVKKIDAVIAENKDTKIAAVLNFVGEPDDEYISKIKALAEKHGITNVALTTTGDAELFKVKDQAELTVMHYKGKTVAYNFASDKDPTPDEIQKIVEGTKSILD